MSRNYVFAPKEYYHVYARGFEKLPVFREVGDYNRFLQSLFLFNSEKPKVLREISRGLTSGASLFDIEKESTLVDIGAYCLMPNHFHLLVREKNEKGISRFMQKLMTAYTMYFNKKYERVGAIFGSSFKAQHVVNDIHLKYLFAYIHLNPKNIVKASLKEYPYSSYPDYTGSVRSQMNILHKEAFPDYFQGRLDSEIEEWVSYEDFQISKG